jgi:hypothetical protein
VGVVLVRAPPPPPPAARVVAPPPPPLTKAGELARLGSIIRARPNDVAARDALLARARLHVEAGEWARAREDLIRLVRRADADPVRAEAAVLLRRVDDGQRASGAQPR